MVRNGHDDTQPHRQRYRCQACASRFDDLSGTVLAGHHQPLRIWVLCLYFMGLNLSNRQIAAELGLGTPDVQLMTEQMRTGLVAKAPEVMVWTTAATVIECRRVGRSCDAIFRGPSRWRLRS